MMPSSRPELIPRVIEILCAIDNLESITRVLDIGHGWGKYGLLLREYLDGSSIMNPRPEWELKIDCVEVCKEYTRPHIMHIYDVVWVDDVRNWVYKIQGKWDIILLIDVIEHLLKEDWLWIYSKIKPRAKWILISTPTKFMKRIDEDLGLYHEMEEHITCYVEKDFPPESLICKDWTYLALLRGSRVSTVDYHQLMDILRRKII